MRRKLKLEAKIKINQNIANHNYLNYHPSSPLTSRHKTKTMVEGDKHLGPMHKFPMDQSQESKHHKIEYYVHIRFNYCCIIQDNTNMDNTMLVAVNYPS